jgi:vacuolar-type H+-ATPase subunit I/STV1
MASKLKAAAGSFERLMLPRLNSIDGELKAMNTRIDAVNGRIDDSVKGLTARIDESDKRAESFRSEFRAELNAVQTKLEAIDQKLDIDRRVTIVEAKLKDLEKRS